VQQSLLPQFLFGSNMLKAVKIRDRIPEDIVKPCSTNGIIHHLKGMHRYTLEMFRTSQFVPQYRDLILQALIDRKIQTTLEGQKKLNWCREVRKLVPLRTNGDGNCLLHAASQYMWGIQDTDLVLRKTLYRALKETDTRNFKFRWQLASVQSQEFVETGLRYNTRNWDDEWEKLVEMASPTTAKGQNGLQYSSLEEIHIFILANILRRTIIVIADNMLRSLESGSSFAPLNIGGIYLPLHWPPQECYKYPIVLGYDTQHFAPLVTLKDSGPEIRAVPLMYNSMGRAEDMKVHFLTETEGKAKEKLLKDYLLLTEIPVQGLEFGITHMINAAKLDEGNLPEELNLVEDYLQLVNHEYKRWQENAEPNRQACNRNPVVFSMSQLSLLEIKCETNHCPFYVSVNTRPYCHECYQQRQTRKAEHKPRGQSPKAGLPNAVLNAPNLRMEFLIRTNENITSGPRSAPPTAPSLALFSETNAMKCKTPKCPFTLAVEHNGLCERCFNLIQSSTCNNVESSSYQEKPKCRVCFQEAPRTFNGMCALCLKRNVSSESAGFPHTYHQRSLSDPSQILRTGLQPSCQLDPEDSVFLSVNQASNSLEERSESKKCRKVGCQYFGTLGKKGFCTFCYYEYAQNNEFVLSSGNLVAGTAAFPNMAPCLGPGCSAYGNPLFEGYCQKCFLEAQDHRLHEARWSGEQLARHYERAPHLRPMQHNVPHSQQLKCARSHCNNFVPSRDELCLQCQQSCLQGGHHARNPQELPKQQCLAPGCDHYGNIKCNGYCNECYLFKQVYG
uniref:ubiquitinyl hydrolase 1 n=1 Tax=Latimeria chalumnae TaxID=7897 RepID=H3B3Q6_LATCH